jgi:deoxyribodipyrimidine photo-lyase
VKRINSNRIRNLRQGAVETGPVVYWMSRDQRVNDNWALIHSVHEALARSNRLIVVFTLVPNFLGAVWRHYDFMLKGLRETEKKLRGLNIPLVVLSGNPSDTLPALIDKTNASLLVTDFDPLRIKKKWIKEVSATISIPFDMVDAHNIVPCWLASQKLEFGAYTLRPKIKKLLHEYLTDFPELTSFPSSNRSGMKEVLWDEIENDIQCDRSVKPVSWIQPGEKTANEKLKDFIENKLHHYNHLRNDPNANAVSDLSPYLHFGHISSQRIAWEISGRIPASEHTEAFLEELIVRKELSDNFCHYNPHYDSFDGFHDWAKTTLNAHRKDEREFLYTKEEFEFAQTHDPLWNAAQMEMVQTGKMHGYMRMYWAKKILEWTTSPEEALSIAICLNDRYELDGRDPNGYTGCAWSIGGVHDRAWTERPVFGKIRFMNDRGCKRKFDVNTYITNNL